MFVEPGDLDAGLVTAVQRTQPAREHADYDAWTPARDEVDAAIELADRFIETIGNLFD